MFGYSLGTNIRVIENVFAFYFVFYLTTVAGVDPAIAGAISSGVVLWAALISPFIGHFADRPGRKRKLIISTTLPIAVLLFLLFSTFNLGTTGNVAYYIIIGGLCYTVYYMFLVPYDSLGAELSEGYDTRTTMRGMCTAFIYISGIVGGTATLYLQGMFTGKGVSVATSWQYAILACCALVLIAGFATYASTKNVDKIQAGGTAAETFEKENVFKSYWEMLKMKPFVALVIWCLVYFTGTTILATDVVYFGIFSLGLGEADAAIFWTVSTVATLVTIIPATALIKKFGKKKIMVASLWIIIIVPVIVYFKGPSSYLDGWAVMIAFSITNSTVLIASFSMLYDIGELTEFITGKQKVGALVGAFIFAMGIAQAIAYATFGVILKMGGFVAAAATQSSSAINTITITATLLPAALVFISMLALIMYKINKNNYDSLLVALDAKRKGREYSTDGFKELL